MAAFCQDAATRFLQGWKLCGGDGGEGTAQHHGKGRTRGELFSQHQKPDDKCHDASQTLN
jgi:hypothetical protein